MGLASRLTPLPDITPALNPGRLGDVIVIVGNPILIATEPRPRAGGLAVGVAVAAAAAGGDVQLVGKTGDDQAGEAALLYLAARSVGHVAILRDPSLPTPIGADPHTAEMAAFDDDEHEPAADPASSAPGPTLEPADLELALRYLPDYRVLVIADPIPPASLDVVLAASRWSGAALVVLVHHGAEAPALSPEATVLEAPVDDPDDAFAGVVGAYAAALDRGEEPAEAFATASTAGGWAAVAD
jgi:sugar/nucleoside kinase (ribokinase family)